MLNAELRRNVTRTRQTTVLVVTRDERIAQLTDRRLETEDGVLAEIA